MKILCFIDGLGAGGAQRQLVGLAFMLKDKGYDVKVCYYHDIPFYREYLDEHKVPHELINGGQNKVKRILAVAKYLKKESPDWVIAYQESPSIIAVVSKLVGCNYKLLVSERNTTQHVRFADRFRFFLYRWADHIVPNSYSQCQLITNKAPKLRGKLTVISNFVDLDAFSYTIHPRKAIPQILVAASVRPHKNTLNFIEALKILRERGIECSVKWYGLNNTAREYIKFCLQKIEEYLLTDYIQLLPKTKDISAEYKECDYFCLPSLYEGTPNVICEAMASGRPVICSNVCDNSMYVHEGQNGWLFDPENPVQIADKLSEMLSLPEKQYYEYCEKSRSLAEELLSSKDFLNKYEKILLDI